MKREEKIKQNMTKGAVLPLLITFAIPVFIGNIVQQIYTLADSIIVGQYLGNRSLAAVGATNSLVYLILGCANGVAGGFAVCTAQAFGSGDRKRLRKYTALITKYCVVFSAVVTVLMLVVNKPVLRLMNTPESILGEAADYLSVIYMGIMVSVGLNAMLAILRSIGDSRTGLFLLAGSSVLNIGLDMFFVAVCKMGVTGAALATVLSQLFVAAICLWYIWKHYEMLHFTRADLTEDSQCFLALMKNGLPMGFQVSITAAATMIIQVALNKCDTDCITAFTICTRIQNILTQTFNAIGMAVATFTGQNFGSRDFVRIRKGVQTAVLASLVCAAACIGLTLLFLDPVIGLFGDEVTEEIVSYCHTFMNCCMAGYVPLSLLFVYRNALQGMGYGIVTLMGGACELIARALVVAVLAAPFGYGGICWGHTAAWTLALLPLIPFYYLWAIRRKDILENHGGNINER